MTEQMIKHRKRLEGMLLDIQRVASSAICLPPKNSPLVEVLAARAAIERCLKSLGDEE